ncbi:aspartate/glutamate racemase family protein [Algicella marina]
MADDIRIGVLMLETRFPRIRGDIGNPDSLPFPLLYRTVPAASPDRVVRQEATGLLPAFLDTARGLVADGVAGITTSCGFMALYQREMAAALPVPVLTSALLQVVPVNAMLPEGRRAGVLTVSEEALSARHLAAVGVPQGTPVQGLALDSHFRRVFLGDNADLDVARARGDVVQAALALQARADRLGGIVLECTNMAPYAGDVARATGLPVFSILTLINWFRAGLVPQVFAAAD